MNSPPDHPGAAILAIALAALPLLLLTAGVLLVAVISACSNSAARRKHSRKVLDDLTVYGVRVLRVLR